MNVVEKKRISSNDEVPPIKLEIENTVYDTVEANCKYAIYLERQEEEIAKYVLCQSELCPNLCAMHNGIIRAESLCPRCAYCL